MIDERNGGAGRIQLPEDDDHERLVADEAAVQERLARIRQQTEAFRRERAAAMYQQMAGLRVQSELSGIYERYQSLVSKDTVSFLSQHSKRVTGEPRRRLLNLLESHIFDFIEAEVRAITDSILTRESEAELTVGRKTLAFRRARLELENEPDRLRRQQIYERRLGVIRDLTPLLAERVQMEEGIARNLGYESYLDMWQQVSGIALEPVIGWCDELLRTTEDMYKEAMGWMLKKKLGLELKDAAPHDVAFLFRGGDFDRYFDRDDLLSVSRRFLSRMKVDIYAGGNIAFDIEEREHKTPRPYSAELEIPHRVILVLRPSGGQRDWQSFLHELGHALHRGYTDEQQPFEYRALGDVSLAETFAFLFQYLTLDRRWLKENLEFSRSRDYLVLAYLEKLFLLRRYAAKLKYELLLHDGNGVEGKDAAYQEALTNALVFSYPKELFLYDRDAHLYTARFFRAWLFEALLCKHLCHYFDEDWYHNPRTGSFLKSHWAYGQRYNVEEMAAEIGYKEFNMQPIEEELFRNL